MNRYDDPDWYEEHGKKNQPPDDTAPTLDDFEHFPFLPEEEAVEHEAQLETTHGQWQKRLTRAAVLLVLIILAFWGGWFSHQFFGNSFQPSDTSQKYVSLFDEAWKNIDQYYVDRKNVDYKKMSYAAINAMIQTLGDPGHTRFMDPQTAHNEDQQLSGKFTGIGIYLHQDPQKKQLTISSTIPGSPAEKAGFKPGDVIIAINGVNMAGKTTDDASKLIQGQVGSSVTLTIQRENENQTRDIQVTRAEINVPNVLMYYIPENHTAHIQMIQFAQGVSSQLRDQVNQAKSQGATRIILDLRNNPGGYLNEAINTVSLFVKDGNVLLEQDKTGRKTPVAVNGNPIDTTSQIVVLVNRNSASAAEIVAGALKDNHRATVIGMKTFGTGTVLEPFNLADGSVLYLGTQEWLTPSGHFIRQDPKDPNSGGITPDVVVNQADNAPLLTPNEESQAHKTEQQILDSGDTQLSSALQYLKSH